MRLIKLGLANLNTTVGALRSNADKVTDFAKRMAAERCTVGCFQEQVISGYPAEDLVQWRSFVDAQWEQLLRIAQATRGFDFPTVFTIGLTVSDSGNLYNAAAVLCGGKVLGVVPKEKLPTYGVFYENRVFARGIPGRVVELNGTSPPLPPSPDRRGGSWGEVPFGDLIFRFPFGIMVVEVCEDIWSPDGPMRRRAYSGAELVVNISASPWRAGVTNTRREMISTRASDYQVTLAYVNEVGGNDSLVFDGGGYINQNGRMLMEAPRWREGLATQIVDLDRTSRLRHENTTWRTDCEAYLRQNPAVRVIESQNGPEANQPGHAYPTPAHKNFFLPAPEPPVHPREEFFQDLVEALVAGLDYFVKTKAFKKIGIALSGGKDSTLTLVIAYLFAERHFEKLNGSSRQAAIRDFIHCFSMPSKYNSETTQNISRTICQELGVTLHEVPIDDAMPREEEATRAMLKSPESGVRSLESKEEHRRSVGRQLRDSAALTPDSGLQTPDSELSDLTRQNIQTRIRGMRMWNWANQAGGMWLQTSNMSEKAVGYTTIGGDMMGAYSLIANLPKTVVIELLRHLEGRYGWKGLRDVLATTASAELKPDQEDEKDLMPFPVLDACFALFAGEKLQVSEVYQAIRQMWTDDDLKAMDSSYQPGKLEEWVRKFARLFVGSIFKWVQTPQAVHLGTLDLDRERALQLPVVQSREWLEPNDPARPG